MQPFTFTRAGNRQEAITLKGSGDNTKFIGGGTNLVDLMKLGVERPAQVIDINALDLGSVQTLQSGAIQIGALVRNSDLAYNEIIRSRYPVLSQALLSGASPQLRNMATVGGNLMQRTRCPYFYDTAFACNKRKPGSGCAAMNGYNRGHAVLGTSNKCIATHPSDMCVALAALDATIQVSGPKGDRAIRIKEFHLLPGDTPEHETSLEKGELITAVTLPVIPYANKSCYLKVRDRASYEFALASAAVALNIESGKIREARVAMGGVGTKPWRSAKAERILTGSNAGERIYERAADAAFENARPLKYNEFKIKLAKHTLIRALETVERMS